MQIIYYMMITDIGQVNVGYLDLLEQNFNYEISQLKYKMEYIQNHPVATELFIKLKYLKSKRVEIKEIPIEEKKQL